MPTRGRLKFDKQGHVYFITTTLCNFERIFSLGDEYNLIVINSIKHLIQDRKLTLYAYVIMPTHLHLLFHLPESESIIDLMRDFKRYTSGKITNLLKLYDCIEILKRLEAYSLGYHKQKYKVWMDRYDDVIITSNEIFRIKFNYIHNNPVKASLVERPEDWKYSSARNYILDDHSILPVRTDLSHI